MNFSSFASLRSVVQRGRKVLLDHIYRRIGSAITFATALCYVLLAALVAGLAFYLREL